MAATLIKLKFRMIINDLMREKWKIVLFAILGIQGALSFAGMIALLTGSAIAGALVGYEGFIYATLSLFSAFIFLMWMIAPVVGYGFDDSLDPRRFATLTYPHRKLGQSLIWATVFGLGSLLTLVLFIPAVIALLGALQWVSAVLFALLIPVALYQYAVWGRALSTTLGHALVSTSKGKDRTALITTLLFLGLVAPMGMWMSWAAQHLSFDTVSQIASGILWTPLVAPFGMAFTVAQGAWVQFGLQVFYTLALLVGGQWLWQRTLPTSMVGKAVPVSVAAEQAISEGRHLVDESLVTKSAGNAAFDLGKELPLLGVFSTLRLNSATVALASRTLQMWLKDPRLSASVLGLLIFPVIAVFMPRLNVDAGEGPNVFMGFSFFIYMMPFILAFTVASLPSYDSTALWGYISAGVTGKQDRVARLLGSFPVVIVMIAAAAGLVGFFNPGQHAFALGIDLLSVFLLGVAVLLPVCSIWLPGVQPPGASPLSTKGAGNQVIVLAMMGIGPLVMLVLYLPIFGLYWLIPSAVLAALVGLLWSSLIAVAGVTISAKLYQANQVKLLAQIRNWPGH
ncbi:hypothetical protein HMPREF0044_0730 [Gleimia coleocanis DSM 15436]|uniref:Uncharacterized protein n=1 Tax=Gleimia coleocanis DSM 15436 TaxID=525245 RepID=C0W0Y7_9ACTO|nr:hypothetical protein [Gleimia coleocanis]EEH63711.1 hypothetical protein HMPREF0044_0730 [Gleimia coleocanis DSM 15436]